MSTGYYQKSKEQLWKKPRERYQNPSEEEKIKRKNMVVNDIEIFLKKKKTKSINMVVSNTEIFLKMKNKG